MFQSLQDANDMVRVRVIRNGEDVPVAVADVVVGDVIHLETGDRVSASRLHDTSSAASWMGVGCSDNCSDDLLVMTTTTKCNLPLHVPWLLC